MAHGSEVAWGPPLLCAKVEAAGGLIVGRFERRGLGVAFERLQIAKAHDPPSQESFDLGPAFDGLDPSYPD
jgi:hypothetical protein